MKKILFISHDASNTGAPIFLLNFLEWLKNESRFEITVFLKLDGALTGDFGKIAATYSPVKRNLLQRGLEKAASKLRANENQIPAELLKQQFDLVYLNTVACLDLAPYLKTIFNCPLICHVHENEFSIKNYFSEYVTRANLNAINHFIAASGSTKDNLVKRHGIDAEKITLVYEFIPVNKIKQQTVAKEVIRNEVGLTDEFVIGGSGLTTWRKGIDLFIQLALVLKELRPNHRIKLLWVGHIRYEFECQLNYEAERLGITNGIIFTGAKADPQNYFQLFDVFVLTSREDPFPLVAIEAAALNKPIVCFSESGGMPEVIEDGKNGVVVPYGNVKEMAKQILRLADDESLRLNMGIEAGKLMEHFDVSVGGKQIVKVIEQLIN